ncbi:hypothetical protein RvY_03111 [Ramazzottius varieornatus]|uniref:ZP domain-containing protein n=1 Tax=Ramazzottius varieornatus TaxID=947166 RepID=A0A1D1UWG1_RAMVA|nr:hypothetical protein RvY_03111 [Ramazzottius varieornatus]
MPNCHLSTAETQGTATACLFRISLHKTSSSDYQFNSTSCTFHLVLQSFTNGHPKE